MLKYEVVARVFVKKSKLKQAGCYSSFFNSWGIHNPLVPLEHPLAVLCHHQRAAKNEQESPQDLLAAQASDGEGRAFVAVDQLHGSKSDGTDAIDPSANLWQVEDAQEEAAYEKATA